jgi:hypothetical protein
MTRTEELLALAEAATPGPWGKGMTSHHTVSLHPKYRGYKIAEFHHASDAALLDAANPETIKQLVELVRLQNKVIRAEHDDNCNCTDEILATLEAFNEWNQQ